MREIVGASAHIAAMTANAIDKVRRLEELAAERPQVSLYTHHVLHAGMYARTIEIPAGVMITGALIKIPTLLILKGDAVVFIDGSATLEMHGYNVIPADAPRKQAIVAQSDVSLTMIFPTKATTVEEAENEFTEEAHLLQSRRM